MSLDALASHVLAFGRAASLCRASLLIGFEGQKRMISMGANWFRLIVILLRCMPRLVGWPRKKPTIRLNCRSTTKDGGLTVTRPGNSDSQQPGCFGRKHTEDRRVRLPGSQQAIGVISEVAGLRSISPNFKTRQACERSVQGSRLAPVFDSRRLHEDSSGRGRTVVCASLFAF